MTENQLKESKNKLLKFIDDVKHSDYDTEIQMMHLNDLEYELFQIDQELYYKKMIKPIKLMLIGFAIVGLSIIVYFIFK